MKPNFFIALLALLFITSCASHEELTSSATSSIVNTDMPKPLSTPVMKAKAIVDNNTYIDVDMQALNKILGDYIRENGLPKYDITADLYPEEYEMSRAAMYRYYSKLVIEDGLLVCTAKSAEELNMSERTFKFMDDNIKRMQKQCIDAREQGLEVDLQPVTANYLNGLIR